MVSGSVVKENGTMVSSPNCSSILEKSMLLLSTLAGVPVLKRYRHLSMVLFTAILFCSSARFSIPFSQLSPFLTAKVNVVFRMPSSGSVHYKNLHPFRVVFKAPLYGENLSLYALQHLLKLCKRRPNPTEVIE